ncbi:MAG: hypothetical protein K5872_06735 [Rhizobiaceae bacterium]|nr:hypothetical protein [Rhizobiaceae bacterium]MCV0405908.1 hypothetical protein [Rhizobiaceae bacterium]
MSIFASTVVALALNANPALPVHVPHATKTTGIQIANLSESEAFAAYTRLLSAGTEMPIMIDEKALRSRILREDPILIGVSR